jgi:hypothetical protein
MFSGKIFMLKKFFLLPVFLSVAFLASSQQPAVSPADFDPLLNARWKGSLTYLDYSSGNSVSIPVELMVSKKSNRRFSLNYSYPEEPQANSQATMSISKSGDRLDKEKVVSRTATGGTAITIVTERSGTDNGKKSLMRYTYYISASELRVKKEVRVEGTHEFFLRNEYRFQKVGN